MQNNVDGTNGSGNNGFKSTAFCYVFLCISPKNLHETEVGYETR